MTDYLIIFDNRIPLVIPAIKPRCILPGPHDDNSMRRSIKNSHKNIHKSKFVIINPSLRNKYPTNYPGPLYRCTPQKLVYPRFEMRESFKGGLVSGIYRNPSQTTTDTCVQCFLQNRKPHLSLLSIPRVSSVSRFVIFLKTVSNPICTANFYNAKPVHYMIKVHLLLDTCYQNP